MTAARRLLGAAEVPVCVLSIAGSDSGAGAGIQADARTIQALGGYAVTAVTAVTAQGLRGVAEWKATPPGLIAAQIRSVLGDYRVAAVKTGLLAGPAAVRAVARELRRHPARRLVVDPVIGSTSGTRFLSSEGLRALLRDLLPLATVATPNWPEAEALCRMRVRTNADAEAAARQLAAEARCAVLVKGGHGRDALCRDCLAMPDGRVRWFESRRVATRNTHGTGCVLSAAIAFELACGLDLEAAVGKARRFLFQSLKKNRKRRWGRGAGPAFAGC
jgi:hydroxymethylpyrimidine/phosphomethylpyrimidine kinase